MNYPTMPSTPPEERFTNEIPLQRIERTILISDESIGGFEATFFIRGEHISWYSDAPLEVMEEYVDDNRGNLSGNEIFNPAKEKEYKMPKK